MSVVRNQYFHLFLFIIDPKEVIRLHKNLCMYKKAVHEILKETVLEVGMWNGWQSRISPSSTSSRRTFVPASTLSLVSHVEQTVKDGHILFCLKHWRIKKRSQRSRSKNGVSRRFHDFFYESHFTSYVWDCTTYMCYVICGVSNKSRYRIFHISTSESTPTFGIYTSCR